MWPFLGSKRPADAGKVSIRGEKKRGTKKSIQFSLSPHLIAIVHGQALVQEGWVAGHFGPNKDKLTRSPFFPGARKEEKQEQNLPLIPGVGMA